MTAEGLNNAGNGTESKRGHSARNTTQCMSLLSVTVNSANMSLQRLYIEMPGQIEPFETAFDSPGYPVARCQFIYLGNRGPGRFSSLLPVDFDWKTLGWGIADYFPQGYTNLLLLEKIYASHPESHDKSGYRTDNRKTLRAYTPKALLKFGAPLNELIIGRLYLVLREPLDINNLNVVIGKVFKAEKAVAMAERYSHTYGRRAVVGLVLANMTWH